MKIGTKLIELNKKRDANAARLVELHAITGDRELSEEENKEVAKLATEATELKAQAATLEAQDRAFQDAANIRKDLQKTVESAPPQPTTQISGGRPNWEDDPAKGFKTPREFCTLVLNAGMTGRFEDERLKYLSAVGSDEHGEYDDSRGGFLVPEAFDPTLLKVTPEADVIGSLTRKIPMTTPVLNIPARTDKTHTSSVSGGLTVSRKAETAAATASRMALEQVKLVAHSLFGLSYATEEILTDSPQSFAALLADSFAEEFSSFLIDERINGTGVGGFKGILKSAALISVTRNTSSDIKAADVYQVRSQTWGYNNAVWLANHDTMPKLFLLNQGVETASVFATGMTGDIPDMLLGRPLIFTEYAASLGTVGDLICVNWNEYLEGTLQPLSSAESIHVRFSNHERAFKFWMRNAGLPWWRSALTPKKSSTTMSPYVTIAT